MIYQSDALSVKRLDGDIAELNFDLQGESVNKFDQQTVTSLTAALDALEAESGIKGLLVTSGKPVFIVGADITEFTSLFGSSKEDIKPFTGTNNANFNRLQNLPYPSCVAINGAAMGGGLEICLACDFRVMSTAAAIGLPETKLGIFPGWGGTVRLPRILGVDEAIMWIATGAGQARRRRPQSWCSGRCGSTRAATGHRPGYAARRRRRQAGLSQPPQGQEQPPAPERHRSDDGLLYHQVDGRRPGRQELSRPGKGRGRY